MLKAKLVIDKDYETARVDDRIFGSFVEHMGRTVYGGVYQPGLLVSDEEGFRTDVMDMVRQLGVPIVRYPGGNFLSGYRWEDTVGPVKDRPIRADVAWRSIETNEFGLNEFMNWCKKAQTEPMMAVNLGTRGMDDARNVLEYCNFKGGTYYSDLRRKHGWEQPHAVKVWCLGNEMDGPWQIGQKKPQEYGHLASQTARLMRGVDPSVELIACGSSTATMSTFGEWEMGVLDECYHDVDYLSMHAYFGKFTGDTGDLLGCSVEMDQFIKDAVALCDAVRVRKRSKKQMNIAFDEWNVNYHFRMANVATPEEWKRWYLTSPSFEMFHARFSEAMAKEPAAEWGKARHLQEDVYTMEDALAVGVLLITLLRHADRVKIACQAQLVNVLGPILTSDEGDCVRQTIFYPYMHASEFGRGTVMQTLVQCGCYESQVYGEVPCLDAVAVMRPDNEGLTVFVVNRSEETAVMESDLRQFAGWRIVKHIVMRSDDLLAANTFETPDRVHPVEVTGQAKLDQGILEARLASYSWNVICLGKESCGS